MSQQQTKDNTKKATGPQGPGANHGAIKFEKDTVQLFGRLLTYFGKGNIAKLIFVVACTITTALISVQASLFIGNIVGETEAVVKLMAATGCEADMSGIIALIVNMAILYFVNLLAIFFQKRTMVSVANGVLFKIREELFSHMQKLPISFFDTNAYGDIMSRYTNDVDNIRQLMSDSIIEVCSSLFTIVSVLFTMIKISWRLTLIVLATVVVMYMVTIVVGGKSSKYFSQRQRALGDMNGFIEEMLNGQKVVKVFCYEEKAKEKFDVTNEDLFRKSVRANSFSNILMPIMANLGNIQYVILAIVGGSMALRGAYGMDLALVVSFLSLSKNFSRPMQMISQQINSFVMALAGARRVFAVLDTPEEMDDGYVTLTKAKLNPDGTLRESDDGKGMWAWKYPHKTSGETEIKMLTGNVVFTDVDFSYTPEKQILYDISIYAHPGQKIAFVGSTGAGKTTITNLINRFYDIEDGKIRIDDININKIKKADLRHALGIVLQDTNLFTGTIADNIRYGKLDATMDQVKAAAKLARADEFIEKLPDGYDTVISGTGSQLSQGQCQLLAIARCAIANPPVMILDEATSSIDTRTEILIQKGMDSLMHGRTTFVIAHRLSTVQNANAIMVVEAGRIIERGNHEELLEKKGRYYQLYTGKSS